MTMTACGGGPGHWEKLLEKEETIAVDNFDGCSEKERNVRRKEKKALW